MQDFRSNSSLSWP